MRFAKLELVEKPQVQIQAQTKQPTTTKVLPVLLQKEKKPRCFCSVLTVCLATPVRPVTDLGSLDDEPCERFFPSFQMDYVMTPSPPTFKSSSMFFYK